MKVNILPFVLLLSLLPTHHAAAHPPWSLAIDLEGNFYFADILRHGRGSVWKVDKDGNATVLLKDFHSHAVYLDGQEVIAAHGEDNHTMVRMRDGMVVDTLVHTMDHHEFFGGNCYYSPSGKIYFQTDHYIWVMEPGQPKRKLSDHYFEWTQTIFVDSRDRVFVPDIGIENGTVWMIDSNGVATKLASDLITKLNRPKDKHNDVLLGIGRDGTGNTYVCETAGKKVKKIKPDGTVLDWYQSEDAWCPTGITWFRGNMYILEYKLDGKMEGPRISRLTTGADRSTVFSFEEENQEASPIEEGGEDKNHLWIVLLFLPVLLALYLGSRMLRK